MQKIYTKFINFIPKKIMQNILKKYITISMINNFLHFGKLVKRHLSKKIYKVVEKKFNDKS